MGLALDYIKREYTLISVPINLLIKMRLSSIKPYQHIKKWNMATYLLK